VSHMPSYGSSGSACTTSGCGGGARLVRYTVDGTEANGGLDFFVPITDDAGAAVTLAADDYSVGLFAYESNNNAPVTAFPPGAGTNRTTTTFRVVLAAVPTIGDILVFQIVES
jgi:hypothetical protein